MVGNVPRWTVGFESRCLPAFAAVAFAELLIVCLCFSPRLSCVESPGLGLNSNALEAEG
jgi:hypothetical protein